MAPVAIPTRLGITMLRARFCASIAIFCKDNVTSAKLGFDYERRGFKTMRLFANRLSLRLGGFFVGFVRSGVRTRFLAGFLFLLRARLHVSRCICILCECFRDLLYGFEC